MGNTNAKRGLTTVETSTDRFYESLTALLRLYQFRDRNRVILSGVTASEAYVLDVLAREGPRWITEIGKELHLNKSTASRLVDSLEDRGLITRRADPDNHRAHLIELTESGARKYEEMTATVKREYASVLDPLPENVRIQLIETLEKLRELAEERMKGSTSELTQFAAVDDDHD